MSAIVNFYFGQGTDAAGRTLSTIWAMSDDELEEIHDHIQWLFPLPEPSQFNPDAPLLTEDDIATFKNNPVLQANLERSFERILRFLGLSLTEAGAVVEGANFPERTADVWSVFNHNWLRITRILRSLTLLGQEKQAKALYNRLAKFVRGAKFPIPTDTFRYWTEASGELA